MASNATPTTDPPPPLVIRSTTETPSTSSETPPKITPKITPKPVEPLANDYEGMLAKLLPVKPDLETAEKVYPTWRIEKWNELEQKKYLPNFECGGSLWRILLYPFGNKVDHVSAYIECGYENVPDEEIWHACAQFAIVLWNPDQPSKYVSHVAQHRFTNAEKDWGFTRFCSLPKKQNSVANDSPLGHNGATHITAYVRVIKDPTGVLWHNFQDYDSKKETGMVGLKNLGATGYLNTILQPLFFINAFRKAVYHIPTVKDAKTDIAWALQRLFYSLQISNTAVSPQELTKSFGWDTKYLFEGQDAVEMLRTLLEQLDTRMKGSPVENSLSDLFTGKMKTYISCTNVDYESSRIEKFWDLQLNVSNNKSLEDSFREYIEVDTLEGELQYFAGEGYGLQDAKKGIIFESFPPVLCLSLKRFQYDIGRDTMVKLNDYHEFPEEFDAAPYLSAGAEKSEPWTYLLVGVIVHDGGISGGHYYAFMRPAKDGKFYKFDDDRVTPATLKEAMNQNFGGGDNNPTRKIRSAYLLTYIRKSRLDHVFGEITKDDLPEHLTDFDPKVLDVRPDPAYKKQETRKEQPYLKISLISDESFRHHSGFDLTDEGLAVGDSAAPKKYSVFGTTKIEEFAQQIALEKGLQSESIRFWIMVNRQNKTIRPSHPLLLRDLTLGEALKNDGIKKGGSYWLWVEVNEMPAGKGLSWPVGPALKNSILVFLKYVDGLNLTVIGVGHIYVQTSDKLSVLSPHIIKIMNWPAKTQVILLEEVKPKMIIPMPSNRTFSSSEIGDGDIIRFQKAIMD